MDPTPNPSGAPFPVEPVPPILLAWAKQTFNMQEYLDGVRDIQENGGKTLEELFSEVATAARGS